MQHDAYLYPWNCRLFPFTKRNRYFSFGRPRNAILKIELQGLVWLRDWLLSLLLIVPGCSNRFSIEDKRPQRNFENRVAGSAVGNHYWAVAILALNTGWPSQVSRRQLRNAILKGSSATQF